MFLQFDRAPGLDPFRIAGKITGKAARMKAAATGRRP